MLDLETNEYRVSLELVLSGVWPSAFCLPPWESSPALDPARLVGDPGNATERGFFMALPTVGSGQAQSVSYLGPCKTQFLYS